MADAADQQTANGAKERQNDGTKDAAPLGDTKQPDPSQENAKKPIIFKRLWIKLDLDLITVMLMFKASLPPTIAIALFQSSAYSNTFSTLGYLTAITSVLGMCMMPRGMFVQSMLLNIIAVCTGAALCLLMLYCGIQARLHTAVPGASPIAYNSSSSAVLAVWLVFQTYLVNTLRSALPQFQFPVIIYSIFLIVSESLR